MQLRRAMWKRHRNPVGDGALDVPKNFTALRKNRARHIYDIAKKLRDTVHRVNDVGQPVGNALVNGISKNSIPDSAESVNKNLHETDRAYLDAVEKGDMETTQEPCRGQCPRRPEKLEV